MQTLHEDEYLGTIVDPHIPEFQVCGPPIHLLISHVSSMLSGLLLSAFDPVADIKPVKVDASNTFPEKSEGGSPVDVILLGLVPNDDSNAVVENLRSLSLAHPEAKIIVLTQRPSYEETLAAFRAGARGLFSVADLQFGLLCKCIRCVFAGQIWADNAVTEHLVASLQPSRTKVLTNGKGQRILTVREQQVLHCLIEGMRNSELAEELMISEHTVKNHLFRIYDKLGVSNRMEAVLYALANSTAPAGAVPRPQPVSSPKCFVDRSSANSFDKRAGGLY